MSRLVFYFACLAILVAACGDDVAERPTGSPTPPPGISKASPTSTISATPAASATPVAEGEVLLVAVGDVMLGRTVGEGILAQGASYPFQFVAEALQAADVAFANLESPITARGQPAPKDFVFRAPALAARSLAEGGIDVVSLANNHALDYGLVGLFDTLAGLEAMGIAQAGAGQDLEEARRPAVLTVKGLNIAFLAYVNTPDDSVSGFSLAATAAGPDKAGVAWATPETVTADVAQASQQYDVVVVSLHTGFEYQEAPNELQAQLAHAAIDAGADLVLGHHPHVLQGIDQYRGGLIIYSLGNFVFDFDATDYAQPGLPSALSLILQVRLSRAGVLSYDFLPVIIGQEDGRPRLVAGEEARPVVERVERLSAVLAGR